ncbi:MAG: hypothetical protein GF311_17700 [Candidatus Lokiarchaeota archaeon]|nr:hypothetical protein [Candidatus Lokiarchaeota archaeon]
MVIFLLADRNYYFLDVDIIIDSGGGPYQADKSFHGYNAFFAGCLFEILLFILSIILIHFWYLRFGIIVGLAGIFFHLFNYLYAYIYVLINVMDNLGGSLIYLNINLFDTYTVLFIIIIFNNALLIILKFRERFYDPKKVRKVILDFGTKFPRIKVKEILEECGTSFNFIIKEINKMIEEEQIYADYFRTSKSVVFNQQANIEEIDYLMQMYNQWESDKSIKK